MNKPKIVFDTPKEPRLDDDIIEFDMSEHDSRLYLAPPCISPAMIPKTSKRTHHQLL